MSIENQMANIGVLPEFDLFMVPAVQASVERGYFTEYRPIASLNSNALIRFDIRTPPDEYIHLDRSLLYIRVKLTYTDADDKSVLSEGKLEKDVSYINFPIESLFSQKDLIVNERYVTTAHSTNQYQGYIRALLGLGTKAKKTWLEAGGWTGDMPKDETILKSLSIKSGDEREFICPFMFDLSFQDRPLIGGPTYSIVLTPADPKFFLISTKNIKAKLEFVDVTFYAWRSRITQAQLEGHLAALREDNMVKYPINRLEVKTFTMPANTSNQTFDNAINGQLPRRTFVGFVSNDAFTGNLKKNPFNFKHFDVNYLACYLDGEQYPRRAYKPNFSKNFFSREYMMLFHSTNQMCSETRLNITREMFKDGFALFAFNFSPDNSEGCSYGRMANPRRVGTMRLEVQFEKPTPEVINVIFFNEYDNIIAIDSQYMVHTDYN